MTWVVSVCDSAFSSFVYIGRFVLNFGVFLLVFVGDLRHVEICPWWRAMMIAGYTGDIYPYDNESV